MSTDWFEPEETEVLTAFTAPGFPPARHPAEADLFARHVDVPGHDQTALSQAHVLVIGAGGLGSWTALGLVRSGLRQLTITDLDFFDRSNAPRQLLFPEDLGKPKASSLARNLLGHMIAGGTIWSLDAAFEEVVDNLPARPNLVLCLVDNNRCRLQAVRFARQNRIPAVFTMLSLDGLRLHSFLQGPKQSDACVWCALPDLDPDAATPCAAATITSCLLAAAYTVFFAHRALMGWANGATPYNWREADLMGGAVERTGVIAPREGCVCAVPACWSSARC